MTSEIAVMNSLAIALAADSAVTVEHPEGHKIYNTVNKLFTLSKYHPVGIMVYGDAKLMGIPWEVVIKTYRSNLGKRKFDTLKEYAQDFIAFLESDSSFFPSSLQEAYFSAIVNSYYNRIKSEIDEQVHDITECDGQIEFLRLQEIVTNTVQKHYEDWERMETLPFASDDWIEEVIEKYKKLILDAKGAVFEQQPISEESLDQLMKLSVYLLCKDSGWGNYSGIVIAGFGDVEVFPSLTEFLCQFIVNSKLKYKEARDIKIDFGNDATIVPFAQQEMIKAFMEGVHPSYLDTLESYLTELFDQYPEKIVDAISQVEESEKEPLIAKLKDLGKALLEEFIEQMKAKRQIDYVSPVVDTVSILPKDELAVMAETFVNLTSFKQKMSLDAETVGEPIDVAVISKGDGFVWIKRKHYFKPDLNWGFFENYFRTSTSDTGGQNEWQ